MATRENQGLQAAVIVLVILTLGLLVGLVLVNNARKTQKARADNAEQQRQQASNNESTARQEASALKQMMGFPEGDALSAIQEQFEADMNQWAGNADADGRNYKSVLTVMSGEKEALVATAATSSEELAELKKRYAALEAEKKAQFATFQEQMAKLSEDLATEQTQFQDEYARIRSENEGVKKQMDELRAEYEARIDELTAEATQLANQIGVLEQSVDKLRAGVPNPDQFAQPADGRITYAVQRLNTVYVDLGSADGLRPQVTFAVAEAGLEDAAQAEQKGSIEITRILGPHRAEARITQAEATNPILPGDRIFSQVWDRGRKVGIGVVGVIDLNGDGNSDLERFKSIVTANGGVVDAAPDAQGVKQGEMNVSTRYLVLGEYPNAARLGALRESWNELSEEAEALGIETISLDEFLSLMGWRSEARTVSLGPDARAEEFPVEPHTQELPRKTGQPAGVFRKRLPNRTY